MLSSPMKIILWRASPFTSRIQLWRNMSSKFFFRDFLSKALVNRSFGIEIAEVCDWAVSSYILLNS